MIKISHISTLVVLCLLSGQAAAQAGAPPLKIGYVNVARIEGESTLVKQNVELLKKEFGPREQQLQDLQKQGNDLTVDFEKNAATMPAAERQAKEKRITAMLQQYQQMQRSVAEDLEVRKREAFGVFIAEVNAVIKGIAEAGKYDLIVQQAVYNSQQTDITDQVIKELAKKRPPPAGK